MITVEKPLGGNQSQRHLRPLGVGVPPKGLRDSRCHPRESLSFCPSNNLKLAHYPIFRPMATIQSAVEEGAKNLNPLASLFSLRAVGTNRVSEVCSAFLFGHRLCPVDLAVADGDELGGGSPWPFDQGRT